MTDTTIIRPDLRRIYTMSSDLAAVIKDYGISADATERAVSRVGYSIEHGNRAVLSGLLGDTVRFCVRGQVEHVPHAAAIIKVDMLRSISGIVESLYDEDGFIIRSDAIGIGGGTIWFTFICADENCREVSVRLSTINID